MALALPSVAISAPVPHELRFANADDVTTLNPALSAETTVGLLSQLTMAYLVRYDKSNRPAPELATTVPTEKNGGISSDGKTITWHLRTDAKWSDGVAFDASDVAFSVAVMQNPANAVVSHDGFALIERVDTPNASTVVFHLKKPYAAFLPRFFGSPPGNPSLLPKHILGALPDINKAPYNALPIGIGPFRYVAWKRGDAVEMEANPFYFRGQPRLRRVSYKIVPDDNSGLTQLQTGELDLLINVKPPNVPRAQSMSGVTVLLQPSYRFVVLAFNVSHRVLQDRAVREALRLGLDRRALLEKVNHGIGLLQASFVPAQYGGYEALPMAPFDLTRANAVLDKAGWKRGTDGFRAEGAQRLSIDLDTVTGAYPQYVELIRSWWTQLGVELNTKTYETKVFYQQPSGIVFGGSFDATIYSIQNFPFVYPSLIYGCDRIPPNGLNLPRYCNPKLDAIMVEYETTYDVERQRRDLAEISRVVESDVPTVVLNYTDNALAFGKRLQNFHPNAVTYFDDMMNVDN